MEMDQEAIEVPLLEGYVSSSTAISPSEDQCIIHTTATKRRTIATHKSAGSPDSNITNKKNVAHKISIDNNKIFQNLNSLVRRRNKTSEQKPLLGCANDRSDSRNADTPKHEFVRPTTADVKRDTNAKQRIRQKTSDEGYQDVYRRNDGTNAPIQVKQKSKQKSNKQHKITSSKSIIDTAHKNKKNNVAPSATLETLGALTNSIQNPSQNPPTDIIKVATVNSYDDAPTNLSNSLPITNLVRRELFNQVAKITRNILKRCQIAVNPTLLSKLDKNSSARCFGIFIKYLHNEDLVALLACDSGRVGFIVPRSSTVERNGCYSAHLYYAPMDEFVRRASINYNGVAPSGGGAVTVAVTNSIEACLATNTSGEAIRPLTPPSSIFNNREPRGIENGNNGGSRSSNMHSRGGRGNGRFNGSRSNSRFPSMTGGFGGHLPMQFGGRGGRGSGFPPMQHSRGGSGSSRDTRAPFQHNQSGDRGGRGHSHFPSMRNGFGGHGFPPNDCFPPMYSCGGNGSRGDRGHQSSGNGLTNQPQRRPLGDLSNNVATKPPPKPQPIISKDTGVVSKISTSGIGQIKPKLCKKPVFIKNNTCYEGRFISPRVGDNVEFTYHLQNDKFEVISITLVSTAQEAAQEEMKRIWDNIPLRVVEKRQIESLPLPLVGEEYDPDSSYISARLEMLREELVELGSSHLTASLERKMTQADALCAVRRRITSEVESICDVKCVSGGMVDKFVDTIVNHVELVSIPSDEMIHCESLGGGMQLYANDDGEMYLMGQCITSLDNRQDNSPALECSHSRRVWEQQLHVDSCVNVLKSLLTNSIRPLAEIIDLLTVPTEEKGILHAIVRSVADCSDPNRCTIKTTRSIDDVQSGIRAVYNATMSIEGATFQQAKKNVKELVHSLGVSEDILCSTVYDMFDKNMASYMEDSLHRPTRRDGCPARAETEEQKEERERYSTCSRNHENLLDNPPAVVGLERLSNKLFPGDVVPICVMHCDKSDYSGGISIQSGGYAKKGTSAGRIKACCTVRNMNAISEAFPSVVNCGVVNGMFCINASASCSLLGKDHQHCPYTTEEMGAGTVGILNSFCETCDRRDICVVLIPFGGSRTGVMENVVNRILPAARKNISRVTTHAQNLSHPIKDMPPAGQRVIVVRTLHSVQESVRNQVAEYNKTRKAKGLSVTLPITELVELAYNSDVLSFACRDIETLMELLANKELDRQQRTALRIAWLREAAKSTGKYVPSTLVYSVSNMPPDMERWLLEVRAEIVKKFSLDSHKKITVQQVISVCGDRSIAVQCKKNNCTPKDLARKALETGAAKSGLTVKDIRRLAGEKGGNAKTEKQNASRKESNIKAHENLKKQVLAAKKDYAIVTCRYCESKEYFFLWSDYENRMSKYEMDKKQKQFRPSHSGTKIHGCTECRGKCVRVGGPWKVVKVLVDPRNGNELGRVDVIE